MNSLTREQAQSLCLRLANTHYENFPVASALLPPHLRQPVAAIYAFARTADDFADEHELDDSTRLALLDAYRDHLDALRRGEHVELPIFIALDEAIRAHGLPFAPLYDLLAAFRQDVEKKRYADFAEVLEYCRRSANPIGRLLLHLFAADTAPNRAYADAICTALQLINFLQDITEDAARGRIYLPQDEMADFGVTEAHIREKQADAAWKMLIDAQIDRIELMLRTGAPLVRVLRGRAALELRFTAAGAMTVLGKLRRRNRHGFIGGQRLRPWDWATIAARAFLI